MIQDVATTYEALWCSELPFRDFLLHILRIRHICFTVRPMCTSILSKENNYSLLFNQTKWAVSQSVDALRYKPESRWFESRQSQCPDVLMRSFAVDRLLRLRVRIPPGPWMFVSRCTVKKKTQDRTIKMKKQEGRKNKEKEFKKENSRWRSLEFFSST